MRDSRTKTTSCPLHTFVSFGRLRREIDKFSLSSVFGEKLCLSFFYNFNMLVVKQQSGGTQHRGRGKIGIVEKDDLKKNEVIENDEKVGRHAQHFLSKFCSVFSFLSESL